MLKFGYSSNKNAHLLEQRGVGFEGIIEEINHGNLLAVTQHHNKKLYPNQRILYVRCLGKVYLVPCLIEEDGTIFLKTLYPSRKATKKFTSLHIKQKNLEEA